MRTFYLWDSTKEKFTEFEILRIILTSYNKNEIQYPSSFLIMNKKTYLVSIVGRVEI